MSNLARRHACGQGPWAVGTCTDCAPIRVGSLPDSRQVLGSPVVWLGAVGLLGLLLFPRVRTALSSTAAAVTTPVAAPLEDLL